MVYLYKTIYDNGFKYIDTSQYSYDLEYFKNDELHITYNRSNTEFKLYCNGIPIKIVYLHQLTTEEFKKLIVVELRKYKLNKLKNGN